MANLKKTLEKAVMANMKMKNEMPEETESPAHMNHKYPYGLMIRLDNKVLKGLKLGVGDFDLEKDVMLKAKCDVVALRSEKHRGELDEFVELQITDLAIVKE